MNGVRVDEWMVFILLGVWCVGWRRRVLLPVCPVCAVRALLIPAQYSPVLLSCRVLFYCRVCGVWVACVSVVFVCGVSPVCYPLVVVEGVAIVDGGVA